MPHGPVFPAPAALHPGRCPGQTTWIEGRGWAEIGYHFLIGETGAIYEGRALQVRGTHVEEHNTGTVGVCLIGDFNFEPPAERQVTAALRLIRWLAAELGLTHLAGHSEFNPATDCPGAHTLPYWTCSPWRLAWREAPAGMCRRRSNSCRRPPLPPGKVVARALSSCRAGLTRHPLRRNGGLTPKDDPTQGECGMMPAFAEAQP